MSAKNKNPPGVDQNINTHISGMTPSIITTINNTSPIPQDETSSINNNKTNLYTKNTKRVAPEPYYESYIEDSFVGHWAREDDDINENPGQADDEAQCDDSVLHPSTIEFDFDSFGPESIVYASSNKDNKTQVAQSATQATETTNDTGSVSKETDKTPCNEIEAKAVNKEPGNNANNIEKSRKERVTFHENPIGDPIDATKIDLRVIEPYKKVISHAGYCHPYDVGQVSSAPSGSAPAVIIFSACYLPDRSRRDYDYVMDNLFLYVLSSLHELIADDYILIYLHNTQPSSNLKASNESASSSSHQDENQRHIQYQTNNLPTFTWIKRCYQLIDRKLRKNLKALYLVRPTFWLKTFVIMCKPFISSKFSKKLQFVEDIESLKNYLALEKLILPASAEEIRRLR